MMKTLLALILIASMGAVAVQTAAPAAPPAAARASAPMPADLLAFDTTTWNHSEIER